MLFGVSQVSVKLWWSLVLLTKYFWFSHFQTHGKIAYLCPLKLGETM